MMLIQQVICNLNRLTKSFNNLVLRVRALECENDNPPEPPPVPSPILTAIAAIPLNADEVTVSLPANIDIVSVLIENTTATPTEEIGVSNIIVTSTSGGTTLVINLNGISNADTFNAIIKYFQL